MEYKREPDKVFDDINRKLGDVIQTAITGGLFYACKQFRKKPKIARVQFSTTACAFCQSHCGAFSLSEFEQSKASNFHSGCRCKTLVTWNKGITKNQPPETRKEDKEREKKPNLCVEDGCKLKEKERAVAMIYVNNGMEIKALKPSGKKRTPDFIINGEKAELKQPIGDKANHSVGKNTIDHQFENANGQARYLIIDLSEIEKYGNEIAKRCHEEIKEKSFNKWAKEFDKVEVVYRGEVKRIK